MKPWISPKSKCVCGSERADVTYRWNLQLALIICSTSGDGVPPAAARDFFDRMEAHPKGDRALQHLQFSVLALGDRNYPQFCAAGKQIDALLEAAGAKRTLARVDVDSAGSFTGLRCLSSGSVSVCLCLCLSLSLSVDLCLSLSLSVFVSVGRSLSVSVSLSLCLSVSVSLCLAASLSLSLCLSISTSLSLCLWISTSLSLCLWISASLSL
jgi:hypothetical protein